jgi:hypothetical protein
MEHSITIAGETFRLTYNITTSANLIETQRPGKSITDLLDSGRLQDLILLMVAGLDETHEKDKRGQLTTTALQKMAEKMSKLVDTHLADGGCDLRTLFLPVKRAVGKSGISGMFLEFLDNGQVQLAEGKDSTAIAAS